MAKYFRYFETIAEFESAYTGEEYVEPFVAYIEENQGVAFNKAQLLNIEIVALAMENDVPATGKTVDKNDCEYTVLGFYDDSTEKDITDKATVTGSLVVGPSQIEERHSAGTLTLTATYDEFEASKSMVVFQEAFVPTPTAITLDDLTWVEDIPASGGTATKDNCSYTVTAYYDNGNEADVTDEAVVTGSLVVEGSERYDRHSAGTLTLTATYSGFNDSDSVTVWQEAAVSYLTFNITSGGDISWGCIGESAATIEYKKNSGEWTEITASPLDPKTTSGGTKINVVAGDKVQFRGNNATYNIEDGTPFGGLISIGAFAGSTAGFTLEGNIMSLIDSVNYKEIIEMTNANNGAFVSLFAMCSGLTSAENLILPATTLANQCYRYMFGGCTSLTTAPELPATTLADSCYGSMFSDCTSLTSAPELPATTLAESCYAEMFNSCTSLTTAPALPATTLATECYYMMFSYCTSLTTAPALPATTLAIFCYQSMFEGCTNLNYIKCLATDISANNCTDSWVNDVAPTGIFIMSQNATDWEIGDNGIPIGWATGDTEDTFITSDEITLSESGGSESASVYSTANPWTASTVDSWITLGANTGDTGLTNLTITAQSSTSVRTGSVTLTDGNMTKTVNVIQDDKAIFTKQPLTFNIICGGTIYLKASGASMNYTYIDYTSNDDNSRTSVYFNSSNPSTINVNAGDKIKFFGNNSHYGTQSGYYQHYCYFSASTGTKFEIEGNIMSLVDDERFVSTTTLSDTYTFCGLFAYCGGLTSAENLILPATALTSYCYTSLFQNCTNLTGTPELPATALTDTYGCYGAMFQGCTSLTTAPALPATTLSGGCYQYMFSGCTNLTTAPELPATTLMESCYLMMFHNCTNLNYIKCLATDISEVSCTTEWVNGVASTGTFVKPNATDWSSKTGNAGIPANWTVEDAS